MQRAAIVGQLAGGILHDFNNVLTVITGMIDILAPAVADEPQLAAAVKLIDQAAARGAALTAHLLAFARSRPSHPREVDVDALLAEAVRLLRPALGGIEVRAVSTGEAPFAFADRAQLMAAVLSLAVAARNAMPEGGRLVFQASAIRPAQGSAPADDAGHDEAIAIAVDAHGYGEVAGHHERIFSDIDMAADLAGQCGGRLEQRAISAERARVEIVLPKAAPAARWLADG
jgi:signal transduction histidine kinase